MFQDLALVIVIYLYILFGAIIIERMQRFLILIFDLSPPCVHEAMGMTLFEQQMYALARHPYPCRWVRTKDTQGTLMRIQQDCPKHSGNTEESEAGLTTLADWKFVNA